MTIKDTLTKYYKKIDPLDIELIIAHEIGKTREFVLAHLEYEIPKLKIKNLKLKILRRGRGEPLAYILDQKEFFGLNFKVNKAVLVPRPETELLVEEALKLCPKNKNIIDIGTGSGNIIISIAKNTAKINNFFGLDISSKALSVAKQNAKIHKVGKKVKFIQGNLTEPLIKKCLAFRDPKSIIFIANLPYLDPRWKNLLKSSNTKGLKYEPQIALYAGKDGLDAYRKLARQLKLLSNKNNILLCEIGHLQKKKMEKIFSFANKINFKKDLAGKWRICKIIL